uniref:phospholipase A2 inhibitor and Ly6/PLAUR domain-containing protein-like n=1 Tax=Centroberyx gerrardi TaxID=166262 RepID=UPI003AADFBD9
MKLILTLALIWTLFNTAEALQCHTCISDDPQCRDTLLIPCFSDSDQRCATAAFKTTLLGNSTQRIDKSCVPSSLCGDGTTYSGNFGILGSLAVSFKCCDTDGCNSETLPFPADQASNNLQCFSCDTPQCNSKIQCVGEENRCFSGRVTNRATIVPTFGCVSANLCEVAPQLVAILANFHFISGPNCCQGNFCNSPGL